MRNKHEVFMARAIRLAQKAQGCTSPNPLVGALVVKGGRVIAAGYHKKAGTAHAEVIALCKAGPSARGATLYVTLEPCAHFGRTPPCVDAVTASGVKHVVIGMQDPNPLNNGKGIAALKSKGIGVTVGVLEDRVRAQNEVFIKYITTGFPFVTVKVGQSLDGRIATRTGSSQWITSEESRAYAHRIREHYDGIMVGVNTVIRDNPRLDASSGTRHPVKIIVDSQLSISEKAAVFASHRPVIIATVASSSGQETSNRKILSPRAHIIDIKGKNGQVNLRQLLKKLARMQLTNILVEGGGTLIGSLFDEMLVDKVLFFVSPKIIGGKEALGSVMGTGVASVADAVRLERVSVRRIREDFLVTGFVQRKKEHV